MSGIKSNKVNREVKGSKRSDKIRKAKFTPASSDTSDLVLSKLLLSVQFGAVSGHHLVVGFNSIMRQLDSDSIDAIIVAQQAPAAVMQMLYEAVLMRNLQRKGKADSCDELVSLCIVSGRVTSKLAEEFKMKRISCIGLKRKGSSSGGDDDASDHIFASIDTVREVLSRHSIVNDCK
jgi:hypothetical protein